MMDNLDARVLFVVEAAVKTIAEHQHIHPLPFEILKVVEENILGHHDAGGYQESNE